VTYLDKADDKLNEEKLKELMDAETWLTAQEAVNYGLADEVLDANQAAASISPTIAEKYKNVPKQIISATSKPKVDKKWREKEKRQAERRLQLVKADLDL